MAYSTWISRMLGLGPRFQSSLLRLLNLGYKCRIRLPLVISAGFTLLHIFVNYVPRIEINVEWIEDEQPAEEEEEVSDTATTTDSVDQEEEEEEEEPDNQPDVSVVVGIVSSRS